MLGIVVGFILAKVSFTVYSIKWSDHFTLARTPRLIKLKDERKYLGQIQGSQYVTTGYKVTTDKTIVITETGSYPVYRHHACIKGKKVWLAEGLDDGYLYLSVEGEKLLWDLDQ